MASKEELISKLYQHNLDLNAFVQNKEGTKRYLHSLQELLYNMQHEMEIVSYAEYKHISSKIQIAKIEIYQLDSLIKVAKDCIKGLNEELNKINEQIKKEKELEEKGLVIFYDFRRDQKKD